VSTVITITKYTRGIYSLRTKKRHSLTANYKTTCYTWNTHCRNKQLLCTLLSFVTQQLVPLLSISRCTVHRAHHRRFKWEVSWCQACSLY